MDFKKKDKRSNLEVERDRLMEDLSKMDPTEDKYDKLLDKAVKVNEMLCTDKEHRLTFDTTALIKGASSLGGILLIMIYENRHVLSTKALNFVSRA